MAKKNEEIWATGRRKCAVARVRIKPGTGIFKLNNKDMKEYFPNASLWGYVNQVLKTVDLDGKIDVTATLDGGGMAGQAGALRHGLARALMIMNEDLRSPLKEAGMVTRDSRVKERKKTGQPGARRRFQFSKR